MLTIAVILFVLKEYNCYVTSPHPNVDVGLKNPVNVDYRNLPIRFDWRDYNVVSPVKDQGNCAACWAFSVIANIESQLKRYWGKEVVLSEQFLIDCDEERGGCHNGSIIQTFANIATKYGGVLQEQDYFPYAEEPKQCRWNPATTQVVPVYGFRRIYDPNFEPEEYMVISVNDGALSAAINSASMEKYTGGIDMPTDEDCDPTHLNHAVLITGYDVYVSESGEEIPYWIIKNSWGTDWGDYGYYYLVRGRNACGIASDVSTAMLW